MRQESRTRGVDFGANIFGVGALADPAALADVARHAEALGYHSVFVADHVVMPRKLESKYPYSRDGGFPYDPDQNSFDAGKVRQRLEQIATQVIEPYRRG